MSDRAAILGALHLRSDGLRLSARDYAALLSRLTERQPAALDTYSSGGVVAELEARFATLLGKELALYLPSGTLANHLALRALTGERRRVLVSAESHLYNDEHDGAQTLSGLNLVPLAPGRGTVTAEEFALAGERSLAPPHPVPVGAISIECPVRRRHGEVFDYGELQRVSALARQRGLGLHLDGARLFVASACQGIPVADYAALCDTVYISLYKCFNAPNGAILAGPGAILERVAASRRAFGAEVHQAWPDALIARHFLDGFLERFRQAQAAARELFALLNRHPRLRIEAIPGGTNVFKLHLHQADPERFAAALARAGVEVRTQDANERFAGVWLVVNESLNSRSPAEIAALFEVALPS